MAPVVTPELHWEMYPPPPSRHLHGLYDGSSQSLGSGKPCGQLHGTAGQLQGTLGQLQGTAGKGEPGGICAAEQLRPGDEAGLLSSQQQRPADPASADDQGLRGEGFDGPLVVVGQACTLHAAEQAQEVGYACTSESTADS
jgi:hypothetical protein